MPQKTSLWQKRVFFLAAAFLLPCIALSAAHAMPDFLPEPTYPYADQQEFWINSAPLRKTDLQGKPVLVMFWTFGCRNCKNSLKWINGVHERMSKDGLLVLGVHTPEFNHEKDKERVRVNTAQLGIKFAVMIDNDYIYWKSLSIEWWPTFLIADSTGRIRGIHIGEVHPDTRKSEKIESLLATLLAE